MIFIIIIFACWFLYKTRLLYHFLQLFQMEPEPEPTTPEPPQKEPESPPNTRATWEKEAYYILAMQGQVNPETVKYMGDEMLKRIVRDYLDI